MCRIYGHFGGAPLPDATLAAVSEMQIHGGPDTQHFLNTRRWSLGSNRLAIQGITGGKQPFTFRNQIFVSFNGEIYNHAELRALLQSHGYDEMDSCDGSILAPLYHLKGESFVEYLDGMFAIALIDCRDSERLLLASDSAGMKSAYYYWNSHRESLHFASELAGLFAFSEIPRQLRAEAIDSVLTARAVCGDETAFTGIYSLAPASLLVVVSGGAPRVTRYVSRITTDTPPLSLASAGKALEELLSSEVARICTADVAVSVITSGGLDSSLLSALCAKHLPQINSFHVCYEGNWPEDERLFARDVAEYLNAKHHEIELRPKDFPAMLPALVKHLGQPNAAPHSLSAWGLFRGISEAGFRVAIAGEGADELFGGYERFRIAAEDPAPWVERYLDLFAPIPQSLKWKLYSPDFASTIRAGIDLGQAIAQELVADRSLENVLGFDQGDRFPAYILRRTDHLSMASAVEVRLPFCQPRIVSFARQLAAPLKISEGRVKRVLYESARGLVPEPVLLRKKQPFTLPVTAMLTPGNQLFDYFSDILRSSRHFARGMFSAPAVNDLFRTQERSPNLSAANALWCLAIIELWFQEFLD